LAAIFRASFEIGKKPPLRIKTILPQRLNDREGVGAELAAP
jgi:hypothetical protein